MEAYIYTSLTSTNCIEIYKLAAPTLLNHPELRAEALKMVNQNSRAINTKLFAISEKETDLIKPQTTQETTKEDTAAGVDARQASPVELMLQ